MMRKLISYILCFIFIMQGAVFTAADTVLNVDSYSLCSSNGTKLSLITAGESASLEMTLTDTSVKTSEILNKDHIEIISVSGCFGTSAVPDKREILSSGAGALKYKLTFSGVTYTGTGSNFGFKVRYSDIGRTSDQINLKISECSPANGSGTVIETDDEGNSVVKVLAPAAEITRNNIQPIKSGDTFDVELTIKNRGAATMLNPVLTIAGTGDISLISNTSSLFIPDIKAGAKTTAKLRFKAEDNLTSAAEGFTATLSYNYNNGISVESADTSAVITIPAVPDPKSGSAPPVQITTGRLSAAQPGKSFTLPVVIKNLGETEMKNVVVSFAPDDGLNITDNRMTEVFSAIGAGETKTINLTCRTDEYVEESYKYLSCEIKYNYTIGKETLSENGSAKLTVPVLSNAKDNADPLIQMTSSDIAGPVAANKSFSFKITVKNVGTTDITNAALNIEGSDEIMLTGGTSAFSVTELKAGESKTFAVKAKTASEIGSASQSINAALKYNYRSGKSYQSGTSDLKISVPCVKTKEDEKTKAPTPNVIIENYSYGSRSIANGESFDLFIAFKNTGSIPVENMVMTVEPAEGLSITADANTYYYSSLPAASTNSRTVGMTVLPDAGSGSAKVNISFKYEYLDNGQRNEATSTQTVSVPVYKADLMEFTPPVFDAPGVVGEEYPFTIEYVNKGRGEIANVRAEITGDIDTVQRAQNLGNFDPGKSGTINFLVTPLEAGENTFSVRITYEDANMKEKERIFNFSLNAEEAYYDDLYIEEEPEEEKGGFDIKIPLGIGGAVAAVAAALIIRKKKKKNKDSFKVNWED